MSRFSTILLIVTAAFCCIGRTCATASPCSDGWTAVAPDIPGRLESIGDSLRRAQDSIITAAYVAIAEDSSQVAEYQKIIAVYKARKQPLEELDVAERMLHANPASAMAHFVYGDVQLDNSDPGNAIIWLNKALTIEPNFVRAHTVMAEAYQMLGANDTALAHLDTALTLNPRYAQAHSQRATLLSQMGRDSEAVTNYRALCELKPEDIRMWLRLGRALVKVDELSEAADALGYAVTLDSTSADALYDFADASLKAGHSEEARKAFEKFMLTFPTDSRALEAERMARAMGGGKP
jgi:tetratricopeptide (TPR) repeat protein